MKTVPSVSGRFGDFALSMPATDPRRSTRTKHRQTGRSFSNLEPSDGTNFGCGGFPANTDHHGALSGPAGLGNKPHATVHPAQCTVKQQHHHHLLRDPGGVASQQPQHVADSNYCVSTADASIGDNGQSWNCADYDAFREIWAGATCGDAGWCPGFFNGDGSALNEQEIDACLQDFDATMPSFFLEPAGPVAPSTGPSHNAVGPCRQEDTEGTTSGGSSSSVKLGAPHSRSRRDSMASSCADSECSSKCDMADRCDGSVCSDDHACEDPDCQIYTCEETKAAAALASIVGEASHQNLAGNQDDQGKLVPSQRQPSAMSFPDPPLPPLPTAGSHQARHDTAPQAAVHTTCDGTGLRPDLVLKHLVEAHGGSEDQTGPSTCVRPCVVDDPRAFKWCPTSCMTIHPQLYGQLQPMDLDLLQAPLDSGRSFQGYDFNPLEMTAECAVPNKTPDDLIAHFNVQHRPYIFNQIQSQTSQQFSNPIQHLSTESHRHLSTPSQVQFQLNHAQQQQPPQIHEMHQYAQQPGPHYQQPHSQQGLTSPFAARQDFASQYGPRQANAINQLSLAAMHHPPSSHSPPGTMALGCTGGSSSPRAPLQMAPLSLPTPSPAQGDASSFDFNHHPSHHTAVPSSLKAEMPSPDSLANSSTAGGDAEKSFRCLWCSGPGGGVCGLVFASATKLNQHVVEAHVRHCTKTDSGYHCGWRDCRRVLEGKSGFPQKSKIERHIQTHTGEKPFACPTCHLTFSAKQALDQHELIHKDSKPLPCTFPGCTKTFRQQSARTMHMRTHTREKPLQCNICHRCFSESSNLSKHRRTHLSKGAYHCGHEGCSKSFHRMDQLRRHVRVHETNKRQSAASAPRTAAGPPPDEGGDDYNDGDDDDCD